MYYDPSGNSAKAICPEKYNELSERQKAGEKLSDEEMAQMKRHERGKDNPYYQAEYQKGQSSRAAYTEANPGTAKGGSAGKSGKGGTYSDEELIKAANDIHYAQYGDAWWGKKNPVTVTQAADGTVVVSKNNGVIGRKSRQKAIEYFGEDVIIVKGRGVNYNNAANTIQTASPNHAEARGIQALISRNIDVTGARQATTLPSCVDCKTLQELLFINNITDKVRGAK